MGMAVSKLSGMPMPVLQNCQSTPRTHVLVSGAPPLKASKWTAMPSIFEVSLLGSVFFERMSSAATRPSASVTGIVSVIRSNFHMSSTSCIA